MILPVLLELSRVDPFSLAILGVFVAAVVSSTVGFAFSALAAGILMQIMNDRIAVVEIMLISSIALQIYCVSLLWTSIELRHFAWFLLGGALALPVGIYVLLALNTPAYSLAVGGILILYGATAFWKRMPVPPWNGRFADVVVGSIGGITGPLVAFPGAAVAMWCSARGLDKLTQRCVYQPYILVMQILTLVGLQIFGETNHIDLRHSLFVVPAVLGAHIGFRIFARITDAQFRLVVSSLLLVSGVWILGKGLH